MGAIIGLIIGFVCGIIVTRKKTGNNFTQKEIRLISSKIESLKGTQRYDTLKSEWIKILSTKNNKAVDVSNRLEQIIKEIEL